MSVKAIRRETHIVMFVVLAWFLLAAVATATTFYYSVDIGSDLELSDPNPDGDNNMDPAWIYTSAAGGGVKEEKTFWSIFGNAPPPNAGQPVPVGDGSPEDAFTYFDIDGEDQLGVEIWVDWPLAQPAVISPAPAYGLFYNPAQLYYSLDDDTAPGWWAADVPVNIAPDRGTTAGGDEILVSIGWLAWPFPGTPASDENNLGLSLNPLPVIEDDDVDALDTRLYNYWFWSCDHEANGGFDPGSIYMTDLGSSPHWVLAITDVTLGLHPDTDLDAFEFCVTDDFSVIQHFQLDPTKSYLAVVFSVDQNDPTTMVDESGGLNPNAIYISLLNPIAPTGAAIPPLEIGVREDDVDAIAFEEAEEEPPDGTKWVQMPDLTTEGMDVRGTTPWVLADDFLCTTNQAITNIVIWGSWRDDRLWQNDPGSVGFVLSFHADVPAVAGGSYSHPTTNALWHQHFPPGSYAVELEKGDIKEWWYTPDLEQPIAYTVGDTNCWKYTFPVSLADAFVQTGRVDNPIVYWLDAQVLSDTPVGTEWGWKTSRDHWNDNAVWALGFEPDIDPWWILNYPSIHPLFEVTNAFDLAFALYGGDVQQDETLDYGDAPEGTVAAMYPTKLINNGARHAIGGPWLGDSTDGPDSEPDGQPDLNAMGDDNNDGNDDEDGVTFPVFVIGQPATVQFVVNGTAGVSVPVEFWIDWNANFIWEASEYYTVTVSGGTHTLPIPIVPTTAVPGSTFARVRIASTATGSPVGFAPDGEVEDYEVFVEEELVFDKWVQYPDLEPTGLDVSAMSSIPCLLADDFLCEERSTITNIVVWGSWLDDFLPLDDPNAVSFKLSIHADIPVRAHPNPDVTWSMPGETLWVQTFNPGDFIVQPEATGLIEGWYDPATGTYIPIADRVCWRYEFAIDPLRAFVQTGTVDNAIVYWLDVQATPLDEGRGAMFGWKTSLDHWNDDACWAPAIDPYNGDWFELVYPNGHQMETLSIDLAFAISGGPVPDPQPDPIDYGDAPDSPFSAPSYPTLIANNGAGHVIGGPWLGGPNDAPDGEPNGIPTLNADGDDIVTFDDENGVSFLPMYVGIYSSIAFTISGANAAGAIVEIWIDWDNNGSWLDAGEAYVLPLLPDGNYGYSVMPPLGTAPGTKYVRCRISNRGTGAPTGLAPDGEVEDYTITVEERIDYGDAPDLGYQTLKASSGAAHIAIGSYLGKSRDVDADGQPSLLADGDDLDGNDDEDGIVFLSGHIRRDRTEVIKVHASGPCILNAWIDYDLDSTWANPAERIFTDVPLVAGSTNLMFHVPAGASVGASFARFRVSTATGLGPAGLAANGEVEDYPIDIREKFPQDLGLKWRQPPDCKYGLNLESYLFEDRQETVVFNQVADDWWCDGRPINAIRWWGSYIEYGERSEPPSARRPDGFRLKWFLDIPAGFVSSFSRPGPLLRETDVTLASYGSRLENLDEATEKYLCTVPLDFLGDAFAGLKEHKYEYNVVLSDPWMEKNTLSREEYQPPCSSNIYWISIQAVYTNTPPDPASDYVWGWETTPRRFNWNDAAVVTNMMAPPPWIPLSYPPNMWPWDRATDHPYVDEPVNMAFAMLSEVVGRRDVKWQQLPNMIEGTDMPSWRYDDPQRPPVPVVQELRADDFISDGRRITDIHWWGSYIGWQSRYNADEFNPIIAPLDPILERPLGFDLSWHETDPNGGPGILLTNVFIPMDRCHEMYYCTIPQSGHEFYMYEHEYQYYVDLLDEKLDALPWLEQEGGHYWLNIQAVFANTFIPGNPVQNPQLPHEGWGWKIAGIEGVDPGVNLEPSVVITNVLTSFAWETSKLPAWHTYRFRSHDLAFELTTDQPDTNEVINIVSIDLTAANDVYVGSIGTGGAGVQVLQKSGALKPSPITWVDVETNAVPFPYPSVNTWLRMSSPNSNEFYRIIEFTP